MIYVVTVEGVYRHAILGVYDSLEFAEARAKEGAQSEKDGYHSFTVGSAEMNSPIKDVVEICSYGKKGGRGQVVRVPAAEGK
jgi:hypothetical protein